MIATRNYYKHISKNLSTPGNVQYLQKHTVTRSIYHNTILPIDNTNNLKTKTSNYTLIKPHIQTGQCHATDKEENIYTTDSNKHT